MSTEQRNVDPEEIARFDQVAARWWDPAGEFRPLHDINPLRADYIDRHTRGVAGKKLLDVGCGGGLLAEAMAVRGAQVLGIDLSTIALDVAREHAQAGGLNVDYRHSAVEELDEQDFDIITCLEMLEHVPAPEAIIAACAERLKPGGDLIVSTINRSPTAFATAIVGAEYLLGLVPRGTHEYARLIRPSELAAWCRQAGLSLRDECGLSYNPLTHSARLTDQISVNYMMHFKREAA
ncbi:bifunctional 2-polyprenyl-6-hydroxyphenol methylase/3-demethylubiquinol 3-O-methyltransferase UbiG [Natronospirillum operosum]|uniref:Ubiquinone biosynthesis O-methyltransferase n=1 Tax=Natronospirillum operosum TaxID=2759953 RepID=A0A4Z0WFK2_9GAMM|nr:bifunctional 2-polyprenyl-6-hydroxyphenol methylase/3-demethylubiquinol 3-O-methyltransferase UbiG [Natronospirillum operosum]TGG95810.1 bifunctional 2-polyprenyl-6-hydroxyphenol methylase/3-demethylubiquinol 3-O-methyltransferase UbiG [Natronospirillum operosum]